MGPQRSRDWLAESRAEREREEATGTGCGVQAGFPSALSPDGAWIQSELWPSALDKQSRMRQTQSQSTDWQTNRLNSERRHSSGWERESREQCATDV